MRKLTLPQIQEIITLERGLDASSIDLKELFQAHQMVQNALQRPAIAQYVTDTLRKPLGDKCNVHLFELNNVLKSTAIIDTLLYLYRRMVDDSVPEKEIKMFWATLLKIANDEPTWFKVQAKYNAKHGSLGVGEYLRDYSKHWRDPFKAFVKHVIPNAPAADVRVILNVDESIKIDIVNTIISSTHSNSISQMQSISNQLIDVIYGDKLNKLFSIKFNYKDVPYKVFSGIMQWQLRRMALSAVKRNLPSMIEDQRGRVVNALSTIDFDNKFRKTGHVEHPDLIPVTDLATCLKLAGKCDMVDFLIKSPMNVLFYKIEFEGDRFIVFYKQSTRQIGISNSSSHVRTQVASKLCSIFSSTEK